MTFRLFVYYSAAWGGVAAFLGWIVGQLLFRDALTLKGLLVGAFVAVGVAVLDALAGGSQRDRTRLGIRAGVAVGLGAVGGLLAGLLGGLVEGLVGKLLLVVGWTLTGAAVGAATAVFDLVDAVRRKAEQRGAKHKLKTGSIGGALGGLVGGLGALGLEIVWGGLFSDADVEALWTAGSTGFMVLGASVGLAVALTQVFKRQAWLRVEASGREVLLTRTETSLGRSDACDVALTGDGVEGVHALIAREGDAWRVFDNKTPNGTLVNGQRIAAPTPLQSGDRIQVGGSVVLFEARVRPAPPPPPPAPVPA